MRFFSVVLSLLLCSSFATAAPKKITLFQDKPSPTVLTATGLSTFTVDPSHPLSGTVDQVLTEGSIQIGSLELRVGGTTVSIGKYWGVGHVLCDGFWVTYERRFVFSRNGGFFITKSATQEESKDTSNEGAMVMCATPRGDGSVTTVVVGYETVAEAYGNLECATGSWRHVKNGFASKQLFTSVPTSTSTFETFNESRTRPFIIAGTYSKNMGFVTEGEVEIPNHC